MAVQLDDFQMDIGRVMPILLSQNSSTGMDSHVNVKDGHWVTENTYDIPGGKVDTLQESSVQRGHGWHTQAVKKTTVMNQEFPAVKSSNSNQLIATSQPGASRLLQELDAATGLQRTDLASSNVSQSVKTTTTQSKTIKLSKISSPFHGQPLEQAIKGKYLNTTSGVYTDYSGHRYTLAEAFEKDLINPDSSVFINPSDGQMTTVHNAIQHGLIEPSGHYSYPVTGERISLEDCIAQSLVVTREVEPIPVDIQQKEEHFRFHVQKVVDPFDGQYIAVDEAIKKGIFDPTKGKYFNVKTGELLSIQEAVSRNLMITAPTGNDSSLTSTAQLIKTSKSYNIVGAIHPVLKKRMSLNEAITEGILDRSKGLYIDTLNNKKYKIQEAIQKGLVVAEEVQSHKGSDSSEIFTKRESTYTVTGVIHPKTKEKLSVSKATELGILDTNQGQYMNLDTKTPLTLNEAIDQGLVLVEHGISKRDERDRKVSSLHIDEEEEEVWTIVEEVKTETKKWVITSVVDPRTNKKISFDDALLEGILDQERGKYCNPDTGAEMSIGVAIERNLIQGELISVNMDGGEYSSFQATVDSIESVKDPRTHKTLTYDAACKLGLIDVNAKTFHNPVTNQTLSFQEAAQRGFIKKKQKSPTPTPKPEPAIKPKAADRVEAHRGKFAAKRNVFEEAGRQSSNSSFDNDSIKTFDESLRVEETKTMVTEYAETKKPQSSVMMSNPSKWKPVEDLQAFSSMSSTRRPTVDPKLYERVDSILERAKMYTDESAISSTETSLSGYTTDWHREKVYNLRTGEELTLDEAVSKGLLDGKQVMLMRNYKQSKVPAKAASETITATKSESLQSKLNGYSPEHMQPSRQIPVQTQRTDSPTLKSSNTSMVVQVSQVQQSKSRIGPISYYTAVRLGLFNIKTGKFRDPVTGLVLGIQDAVTQGFLQANGDALINLTTGSAISLADCIQRNLIDPETGKIFESKLKQLNIAVPNQFMASRSIRNNPINFEDALKVGLLNPYTAEFNHPQSDEVSSLADAVSQGYIFGKSVTVQDPTTGLRYYLDDALKRGIVNPETGNIMDVNKEQKIVSFNDAIKAKLFESVYNPFDHTVLDPNNGQKVDVNQAIRRSLLGHNTCLIYDTDKGKQVTFDEAVQDDIVDRQTGLYVDKKGGRRLVCKTAAEMGFIEPIGAPVLNKMRLNDCLQKLYTPVGDSISAPAYTMYEDVRSTDVSLYRKPEIRTEVDTHEYKTERTIKLSKGEKANSIDVAPGDKVLTPRPYQAGKPSKPQEPVEGPVTEEIIQKTSKPPVQSMFQPNRPTPNPISPAGPKIVSVTEERIETVETKSGTKKKRQHVDNISAPEYFTKGERLDIRIEDDDEIDSYKLNLKTNKPQDINWDLNVLQPPPKEQMFTKVIEEVVEEIVDDDDEVSNTVPNTNTVPKMDIKIQTIERPPPKKEISPPPEVKEEEVPVRAPPVRNPQQESPPQPPLLSPQRIRDKEIIIIEREGGNITKNINITIENALEEGFIDLPNRLFTHPVTGETMPLVEAIKKGYIQGSGDDIRKAITSYYERQKQSRSIMEYSTTQEFSSFVEKESRGMSLADAISGKYLDAKSGKFTSPESGLTYMLKEAVEAGMIDGDSAHFTNPGNKKVFSLKEALDNKVLDSNGKWISPLTGHKQPLSDAIKKGYVQMVSSEQTIKKVTTITEVKKVAVDYVIHPISRKKIDYNQALIDGIISTVEGIYRSPATGDVLSLDDAVKYGLIAGEVLDTRRRTEEKVLDSTNIVAHTMSEEEKEKNNGESHESSLHIIRSPMRSYVIDTVIDPRNQRTISAGEAIKLGIINPSTALYTNIVTGEQITFEEAIKRRLLRCMETTELPDNEKFNILGVICPRTGQELSMSQALDEGILDFMQGVYINTVTGKTMSFADAINKKLIRCEGKVPEGLTSTSRTDEQEEITDAKFTDTKAYTITGAKDTKTGQQVAIKEAIKRGILDNDLSTYRDLKTGKSYTIQEAIDEGLLVATLEDPNKPKEETDASTTVKTTKVYDIESVIDPKTNEEISAKEAVERGIINEATGDYVNVDTMESWSMDNAIKKGMVKARPIPAYDTVSFSISAVIDPKTGEQMAVSDALRHGFLDRGRKQFCNAHTGEVCSLDEALRNGWIVIKSNYDKSGNQTGLSFRGQPIRKYAGPSGFQTFTILSVLDAKTGEDLPVAEAVRRGILDQAKRNYRDTLTGETMVLDAAIKRNFIKLGTSSTGLSKISFSEALRRGYINPQTGKFACPSTGQIMSVDEAVRRGLLVDETGLRFGAEDMTMRPGANRQTRSFETALRDGMIDTSSGKFLNPESGETMTISRAVNQGHLAPKTQWRAYSYRTLQSQRDMAGPVSPGSGVSNTSFKHDDPVYSTIHKTRTLSSTQGADMNSGPIDIYTAKQRGLLNTVTGEVTLPQYGTSMLIDDAIMQGLIVTSIPLNAILSRPAAPTAISIFQAFQQGMINPLNLSVRNSSGHFISFEEALVSGLLYPRTSSSFVRENSVAKEPAVVADTFRATSLPPNAKPKSQSYSYSHKMATHETRSGPHPKVGNATMSRPPNMHVNGGAYMRQGAGTLPILHNSTQEQFHRQQSNGISQKQSFYPEPVRSPLLNGNAHFVNGKLFASRVGYKIEGNGNVINLASGETFDLNQALRMNIVQQIPDDEHDNVTGRHHTINSMFNRDPASYSANVNSLPFVSAAVSDINPATITPKPFAVSQQMTYNGNAASAPVHSEFYSSSSERFYSEINH